LSKEIWLLRERGMSGTSLCLFYPMIIFVRVLAN